MGIGERAVTGGRIDRRISHAMRILENGQTSLPETSAVAARVGMSLSGTGDP